MRWFLGFASLFVVSATLAAQWPASLQNGDFERGADQPDDWFIPAVCVEAGFRFESVQREDREDRCARIRCAEAGEQFGNCVQSIDAAAFRGKRVRFRASVRMQAGASGGHAQLWMRIDRPNRVHGFFDNMRDRPIVEGEWRDYDIVGDVAVDAEQIVLGLMLFGTGEVRMDDAVLEVVERDTASTAESMTSAPGLVELRYEVDARSFFGAKKGVLRYPLPLAYRDQTPLTFRLQIEPAQAAFARIVEGPGPNRVLELELRDIGFRSEWKIAYQSTVLVAPTSFEALPERVAYPDEWPEEVQPWLASTWCCDHEHERVADLVKSIRTDGDDVRTVIRRTLERAEQVFRGAEGRVQNLTAVEALDGQGSCTSCANLVCALLRGANIPARILAGYPLWSGPLQTHYIVEAYVPTFGWYPIESTLCQEGWPNHSQVNVSIVPVEHESEELAGRRTQVAGGVPYMTLTERPQDNCVTCVGTLKKYCDHEARFVRGIEAQPDEWGRAQEWARARWAKWLASTPKIEDGRYAFGPDSAEIEAESLEALMRVGALR